MQRYVDASARHDNARRIGVVLDRILADQARHARFVNTLARLEYIGVRKMLKSRQADRLDLEGLQHVLDEAVHTLRLKKAAVSLAAAASAGAPGAAVSPVATFSAADTLAGDAGEAYFQGVDHHAESAVADLPPSRRAEANYLLTSAAIEVRAQVFYPIYEARLRAHGAPFSVASITKDEDRHLGEMADGLARTLGDGWPRYLAPTLEAEELLFSRFLDALADAIPDPALGPPP